MGCIWYQKPMSLQCLKATVQRWLEVVELSSDHSKKGTKKPPCSVGADYCRDLMQVFPCFHCGGSLTPHLQNLNERGKDETLERWVYRLAQALKKHPAHWVDALLVQNECVRSCSVFPFLYNQDLDGKNKNNLFHIGKYREILMFQKGCNKETLYWFKLTYSKFSNNWIFMFQ